MIDRREFSTYFLTTLGVLSLPKTVLAMPSVSELQLTHAPLQIMPTIESDSAWYGTQIKVIGVGGGGCNAITNMNDQRVPGVEYICVNTDTQALRHSRAHKTIQLGTSGLSTGGRPKLGHAAASQAQDEIRAAIDGAHMLFIIAGMGGGTGTGAAPVIARIAKKLDILTVGVVTLPFDFEGKDRWSNAEAGLRNLEAQVGSVIVLSNEKLLNHLPKDATQNDIFGYVDDLTQCAVCGVAKILNVLPGANGVDFEDVKFVLSQSGKTILANVIASGPDRVHHAVDYALTSLARDGIDLSAAKAMLMMFSGAEGSWKFSDYSLARNIFRKYASPDSSLIYGSVYDESLSEKIRITLMVTGV